MGNRPTTFFNKEGWHHIVAKFKEITGRDYNRIKMKNKWDQLKKDWKIWKELKRGSTGMGWDSVKRTIDAPEDWWTEKLQVVSSAKKFKFVGIDPVFEEKLDRIFTGIVATGTHAYTPNDIGFGSSAQEMDTVHIGDSGEGPTHVHTDVQSTSVPKHPKVDKNNKGVAFIKGTIDALVETCKARSSSSQDTSIDECLQVLNTYSDVKEDDDYIQYVKVLRDPIIRQFFMKLEPKYRVKYLRSFMDD